MSSAESEGTYHQVSKSDVIMFGIHVAWHSTYGNHVGIRAAMGEGTKERV